MTTCVRCGGPVPEPGLWLVRPIFDGPYVDVCSQRCGQAHYTERQLAFVGTGPQGRRAS